jgi:Uncharacterized alpha/beta hydrolase domain (DUF2235)
MSANVTFGDFAPETQSKKVVDITLGIFFDGTLNNKTNTDEGTKQTAAFKKNGYSKKSDTSYYNDRTNVARLWEHLKDDKKIYIEGIGTEDRKEDSTMGYGFGTGPTGVRGKVRIGCEKIVEKAMAEKNAKGAEKIGTITLDVYGFSRGAAAARNFVYEISKAKYNAMVFTDPESGYTFKSDSDDFSTDKDVLPKRGHLGLKLEEKGLEVDLVKIRFLGIFDTVSSYSKNFSVSPDFNDIEELSLNKIGHAKSVVHYIAADEHRQNFAITPTPVGVEKTFPGVHSDVGGSYYDGVEVVEELETTWTNSRKLDPFKKKLINEGWYKEEQLKITGGNFYFALQGTRDLKKSYSFIPLHFMAEAGISHEVPFNKGTLELSYKMSDNPLLVRVKARLRDYVFGNKGQYLYKDQELLDKEYTNQTSSEKIAAYNKELGEQKDLKELRNIYLHWSAKREGIGLDPTKDRKRIVYK